MKKSMTILSFAAMVVACATGAASYTYKTDIQCYVGGTPTVQLGETPSSCNNQMLTVNFIYSCGSNLFDTGTCCLYADCEIQVNMNPHGIPTWESIYSSGCSQVDCSACGSYQNQATKQWKQPSGYNGAQLKAFITTYGSQNPCNGECSDSINITTFDWIGSY